MTLRNAKLVFFLSQLASADSIKLIQVFVESSVVTIYVVL